MEGQGIGEIGGRGGRLTKIKEIYKKKSHMAVGHHLKTTAMMADEYK